MLQENSRWSKYIDHPLGGMLQHCPARGMYMFCGSALANYYFNNSNNNFMSAVYTE